MNRREMGEKGTDLLWPHGGRIAFLMEEDKPLDPIHICLFRAKTVVFEPDCRAYLGEEFRLVRHVVHTVYSPRVFV